MRRFTGWTLLFTRLLIGGVFLIAGVLKALDADATVRSVRAYDLLPESLAHLVGWGLPFAEILAGAFLIAGVFTRTAAVITALMLLAFVAGIAQAWARGLAIDCGCFGTSYTTGADPVAYAIDIARDALMIAGCAGLTLAGPGRYAVQTPLNRWFAAAEPTTGDH